jgi:hypothetical protein
MVFFFKIRSDNMNQKELTMKPYRIKPYRINIISAFSLFIPLFFLFSCTGAVKKPLYLSPALETGNILTLGIMPVSYTERYDEPLDVRLSPLILRHARKQLEARGYRTRILGEDSLSGSRGADLLTVPPADAAAGLPDSLDGVVAIRIRSHFGIDLTDRHPDIIMGPAITMNAEARLISLHPPEDLWRDKGMGRSYTEGLFLLSTQFPVRLNQAVADLTKHLFSTLPPVPTDRQDTH